MVESGIFIIETQDGSRSFNHVVAKTGITGVWLFGMIGMFVSRIIPLPSQAAIGCQVVIVSEIVNIIYFRNDPGCIYFAYAFDGSKDRVVFIVVSFDQP